MSAATADLRRLFESSGALLQGHFKLSSGRHAEEYFQCALVLADPSAAGELGGRLAALVRGKGWEPGIVVSPALGGIVIGHEVGRGLELRALFAERQEGELTLRRGFALRPRQRVLVVEDVITTGKSTGEVVRLIKALGAVPVGAASLVLRAESVPELGVPLASLAHWPVRSFPEARCPLCAEGKVLQKPGSRPG